MSETQVFSESGLHRNKEGRDGTQGFYTWDDFTIEQQDLFRADFGLDLSWELFGIGAQWNDEHFYQPLLSRCKDLKAEVERLNKAFEDCNENRTYWLQRIIKAGQKFGYSGDQCAETAMEIIEESALTATPPKPVVWVDDGGFIVDENGQIANAGFILKSTVRYLVNHHIADVRVWEPPEPTCDKCGQPLKATPEG